MSAAVMSPLGTMSSIREYIEEDEAHAIVSLFDECEESSEDVKPMQDGDDVISIPSLSDDLFADVEMDITDTNPAFGGLNNLGNTCYLASALQMLASLDRLSLTSRTPEVDSTLRHEFLQLLERLGNGETVNPEAFKRAVDVRSPLFIGYRQQDSHEFLTTLLALLDEDYNAKTVDETMETSDENQEADKAEEQTESIEEPTQSMIEEIAVRHESTDDVVAVSSRKPSPECHLSFTQLQVDDISDLLYGQGSERESKESREVAAAIAPQFKLIGGRAIVLMSGVTPLESVDEQKDDLSSSMSESPQSPQNEAASEQESDPSPVEEYFCTEVRCRLTCDSCKYTRCHLEKYLHLSLDIGSDSGSVEEGLRKFFAPEVRQFKCEKCFCETATQTLEISRLPRALLLHCKRFIVDVSPDYSIISYRKNQSPFVFVEALDDSILGDYFAPDLDMPWRQPRFRIKSVVNHIGSSASCGHYTTDAMRQYPNGERRWTRFNDSRVSPIEVNDAMGASAQRTAYMVLYELE